MFTLRRPLGCSWDQIWPIGALRGPWGPPKGLFGAKFSPFKAPLGPEGVRYQVKVSFDHEPNSGGPMGGSWDQIWLPRPPEDLRGPQKGLLGPNRALSGRPGAQKGPNIWSKCVLTMSLTQVGQWGAGGTKSGSPRPSEDLRDPQKQSSLSRSPSHLGDKNTHRAEP